MASDRLTDLVNLINATYGTGSPSKDAIHEIGKYLTEAFNLLPRGKFSKWVVDNLTVSASDAYNYKWWYVHYTKMSSNDAIETIKKLRAENEKLKQQLESLRK